MNVNAMGAIIILISAASCFATYIIGVKLKIWGIRLVPASICFIGAVVCYFIYKKLSDNTSMDISTLSYTIVFGISFAVAFTTSILTIGVVYIKENLAKVFMKRK